VRFFVHPLFILTACVAIYVSAINFFLSLTIAVIFHEFAHVIVARNLGVIASQITLTPFGCALNLNTKILTSRHKSLIYLSGPIASLSLSLFFGVIVWLFPTIFSYLEYLVAANFLVGVINLLPIYPLDGGKVLSQILSVKIVFIFSNLVFGVILLFNLIIFNWWWIFFAIIMIIQINFDFKYIVYNDKFNYRGTQKTGRFVRCGVLSSTTLLSAYRMINCKRPTEFLVLDLHNKIFYEKDLEEWLITYNLDTKIARCLSR